MPMSTGYLTHPDMKRFEINDSTVFVPPRPMSPTELLLLHHHHQVLEISLLAISLEYLSTYLIQNVIPSWKE